MAVALWNNYSNPGAFTSFMTGCHLDHSVVPINKPWRDEEDTDREPVPSQAVDSGEGKKGVESGKDEESKETEGRSTTSIADKKFRGDHALARSASFMYETLVSKEVAQAVAEGDIGRVYEGIKVSFHSTVTPVSNKYTADDAGHIRRILTYQVYWLPARHNQLLGVRCWPGVTDHVSAELVGQPVR